MSVDEHEKDELLELFKNGPQEVIYLSDADFERFMAVCNAPPKPNEKLNAALKKSVEWDEESA